MKEVLWPLVVLAALAGAQEDSRRHRLRFDALVQPLYEIDFGREQGEFALNRARLGFAHDFRVGELRVDSELEVDFSKREEERMLHNASVTVRASPWLRVQMGRFKHPFGMNSMTSSRNLPLIWRTRLTRHLRRELATAGRSEGVMVYGNVAEKASYHAGLFTYAGYHLQGGGVRDLFQHPVGAVSFSPHPVVEVVYSVSAPSMKLTLVTGEVIGKRHVFHDIGVVVAAGERYRGEVEFFLGPDTADGRTFHHYLDGYREILTHGVTVHQTLSFAAPLVQGIDATVVGEYLNGLRYNEWVYANRSTYFVAAVGMKVRISPEFFVDVGGQMQFDERFRFNRQAQGGVQITCLPHWRFRGR